MANIAVFIDHDIMIRHFMSNHVLQSLEEDHDLLYIFPENHKRVKYDLSRLGLKNLAYLPISNERVYLYRRLYQTTVLKLIRRTPDKQAVFAFWRNVLGERGFRKTWFYSWPGTYHYYKRTMLKRIGKNEPLERLMEATKPDLILHPTVLEGLFVSDLIAWGRRNGVPTLYIMNSWDNPASKAMTVGYPDCLAVWGEQTEQHAVHHMGMPKENIRRLGAAQFDLYRQPPEQSAEDYRQALGIPLDRKVLLYAGSSKGLNEINHLEILDQAVETGDLPDCALLFRPHPWRQYPSEEKDFYSVKWKHVHIAPEMEQSYMRGRTGGEILVDLADYRQTHTTLCAVDAVISPLSTILLEAALHGKPVGAYLPDEDLREKFWIRTTARQAHFREFFERVDCIKCERPEDLISVCSMLIRKSEKPWIEEALKKQCEFFVEPFGSGYSERLKSLISQMTQSRSK